MLIVWNFVYKNHWSNLSFSHSSRGYCCYVTLIIKNKKEKKSLASHCVKLLGTDDIILLPTVLCKLCHYLLSLRPSFMNCNCWHTHTRLPTHPHTQGVCMWACLQTLSLLIAGFVFYSKCWWGSVVCTKYEVRWDEQALTKSPLFPQQSVLSCNAIKD